jgi:hypothetical protein
MFRIPSLTIVFALVASAALAQSLPPQPAPPAGMGLPGNEQERNACRPDVMKFCKELLPADQSAQPDTIAIANCLFANQKKVSPGCNRVLTGHPQ